MRREGREEGTPDNVCVSLSLCVCVRARYPPRSFSTKLPAVQALESVVNSMLEGRDDLQRFAADALPVSYNELSLQGVFPSLA